MEISLILIPDDVPGLIEHISNQVKVNQDPDSSIPTVTDEDIRDYLVDHHDQITRYGLDPDPWLTAALYNSYAVLVTHDINITHNPLRAVKTETVKGVELMFPVIFVKNAPSHVIIARTKIMEDLFHVHKPN